jgi:DNA-binding response OmpR family regulator
MPVTARPPGTSTQAARIAEHPFFLSAVVPIQCCLPAMGPTRRAMMMKHIVVFNHSTSLLFLFRSVLMELGYQVSTYIDTLPEVELLRMLKPDLLILGNLVGYADDDFEVVRALRRDREVEQLPVILCTTSPHQYMHLIEQENVSYVQVLEKPFSFAGLRAAVAAALGEF